MEIGEEQTRLTTHWVVAVAIQDMFLGVID